MRVRVTAQPGSEKMQGGVDAEIKGWGSRLGYDGTKRLRIAPMGLQGVICGGVHRGKFTTGQLH